MDLLNNLTHSQVTTHSQHTHNTLTFFIVLEITGPSRRVHAGTAKSFSWPLGAMFLALLSYYVQNWKWSQLIISIAPLLAGFLSIL